MVVQIERCGSGTRVRNGVAGFLCMMGLPFIVLVVPDVWPWQDVVRLGASNSVLGSTHPRASWPRSSSATGNPGLG